MLIESKILLKTVQLKIKGILRILQINKLIVNTYCAWSLLP